VASFVARVSHPKRSTSVVSHHLPFLMGSHFLHSRQIGRDDAGGDFFNIPKMEQVCTDERAEHAGHKSHRRSLVRDEGECAYRGKQGRKQAWHCDADPFDWFRNPIVCDRVDEDRQEQSSERLHASRRHMGRLIER
jgi:hypothetical protein